MNKMLNDATILFSGGSDSTLAAVRMLERHRRVHLLTFDQGLIFFVDRTKIHADLLKEKFGGDRVIHEIIDIRGFFKTVMFGSLRHDLRTYGPNLTVQVCHGCRIAMHAHAALYNLLNGIKYLADGNIEKQGGEPFQLRSMMSFNRENYKEFGIVYSSPVYNETRSDLVLEELGLAARQKLKKQFILYDTQPTCAVGVPADVYARIFYRGMMKERHRMDSERYRMEKEPLFREFLEIECERNGHKLTDLIERLQLFDIEIESPAATEPAEAAI